MKNNPRRSFLKKATTLAAAGSLAQVVQVDRADARSFSGRESGTRKIAILGGGLAGLVAAHDLRQKGYKHITVFDTSSRLGGKCHSFEIDGKIHELGATVVGSGTYPVIMDLIRKFELEVVDAPTDLALIDPSAASESGRVRPIPNRTFFETATSPAAFYLHEELQKTKLSLQAGFADYGKASHLPFFPWLESKNLGALKPFMALLTAGYGFGDPRHVSAAYYSKLIPLHMSTLPKKNLKNGFGELIDKLCADVDIRLGTKLKNISRTEYGIQLITHRSSECFDDLILACPFESLCEVMPAKNSHELEEHRLFKKIKYQPMHVFVCEIESFPSQKIGLFTKNYFPTVDGKPLIWTKRHDDQPVYVFLCGGGRVSKEKTFANVKASIDQLGGSLTKLHSYRHWETNFPHISQDDMRNGYFDFFENNQGVNRTYYTGSRMNFETAEKAAEHARYVINRYF